MTAGGAGAYSTVRDIGPLPRGASSRGSNEHGSVLKPATPATRFESQYQPDLRVRAETGANAVVLSLAIASAAVVLVTFVLTTLIHEPASLVTLLAILLLSIGLDAGWKRTGAGTANPVAPAH